MSKIESSSAENGAVGVAGGTSFVGVIQMLPASWHGLADGLMFLAPALSIGAGFSWKLLRIFLAKRALDRQLEAAITTARGHRDTICGDQRSTAEHKDNAQRSVENLEQLRFAALENDYERVQAHLTQGL